jgi:hypothetical protein
MTLALRRGQHGVLPEMQILLGRLQSRGKKGGKSTFEACPQDLPLRTLVPMPPKGTKVPTSTSSMSLLQQRKGKVDPLAPDMLPELPPAPQVRHLHVFLVY